MIRSINSLLTFFLVMAQLSTFGQGQDINLNLNVTPLSPEATSLGKYLETPVSKFTGIPGISIPLHTISNHSVTVDIGLSYHAGGIKVEEIASMVGLGWNFNAGGAIIRQTQGLPDDLSVIGYLNSNYKPTDFLADVGSQEMVTKMHEVMNSNLDLEPDIYSISVAGLSAQFFFDETGNYYFKSHQDLKVEHVDDPNGVINGWIITSPDGTKYYFGKSMDLQRKAVDQSSIFIRSGTHNNVLDPYITAWYLLDIVDANDVDEIKFYYTNSISRVCTRSSEKKLWFLGGEECTEMPTNITATYSESITAGVLLDSISSPTSSVKFKKLTGRLDLTNSNRLDELLIYNSAQKVYKKFIFKYSYFESLSTNLPAIQCQLSDDERTKRLKLTTLFEGDASGNFLPPYKFYYEESVQLPERFSYATDYWGYFNGQTENTTLIPQMEYYGSIYVSFDGANRVPNDQFSTACALYKIEFPLGGSTEFELEGNRAIPGSWMKIPGITDSRLLNIIDIDNNTYSEQLIINNYGNGGAFVDYEFMSPPSCAANSKDCLLSIDIKDNNEPGIANFLEIHDFQGQFYIPNGNYTVTVKNYIDNFNFDRMLMRWKESLDNSGEALVGGLRVRKITTYDNIEGSLITNYNYDQFSQPGVTSGLLTITPFMGWEENNECMNCNWFVRASISQYPLSTTRGGHVGYTNVSESKGESNVIGYTNSTFSFDYDEFDLTFPFVPPDVYESTRGDLLKSENFNNLNLVVRRKDYDFTSLLEQSDPHKKRISGIKVSGNYDGTSACFKEYSITGFWRYLDSESETIFDVQGGSTTIGTRYIYGNPLLHVMPTKVIKELNEQESIETTLLYPQNPSTDFTFSLDTKLITAKSEMLTRFMIAPVIEEITLKINGAEQTTIGKKRTEYRVNSENHVVRDEIYQAPDGVHYRQLQKFDKYSSGRIIQAANYNSGPESFVWSQNKTLLLAYVKNASENQIFYSSFEEGLNTQDDFALSGKYAKQLDASYKVPELPEVNGDYILTYWWKSDLQVEWQYEEILLPNYVAGSSIATTQISGFIDEVRLYPIGAIFKSYCYDDSGRLITEIDLNSRSTHYEYDSFGRLLYIRDHEQNILQYIKYILAGQN